MRTLTTKRAQTWWAVGPPAAFLTLFFVAPLVLMIQQSLWNPKFGVGGYSVSVANPAFRAGFEHSITLALLTTAVTALLGSVLVWTLHMGGKVSRTIVVVALLLPLVTSGELVRILAWMIALSPSGPIAKLFHALGLISASSGLYPSVFAVVLALVNILLPFFVFVVYSATKDMDKRAVSAAHLLGANRIQAFLTAGLPQAVPGLCSGMLLVFMMTLGYYATPAALGPPTATVLPTLIANEITALGDWGQGAALGVELLVVTLVLMAVLARLGVMETLFGRAAGLPKRAQRHMLSQAWTGIWTTRVLSRLTGALDTISGVFVIGRTLRIAVTAGIALYLATPLIIILPASLTPSQLLTFPPKGTSLKWYHAFFQDAGWLGSARTSLVVAAVTAVVATALGAAAAFALTRARFKGKTAFFMLLVSPLVMPWIVPALGLYFEMVKLHLAYTSEGIMIGHVVLALPYTVMVLSAALSQFDWNIERAARMSGAALWRRIRDIFGPLLRPAILSALLFAFLTSFTEFVYAYLMSDVTLQTLPVKMWQGITYSISPTVAAAAGVLTLVIVAGLGITGGVQAATAVRVRRLRRRTGQTAGAMSTLGKYAPLP